MSKNRRDHCRYYSCGAHHTDAPSSNLEIQHFVNTWAAICAVHTVQIACRAPRTNIFRKCNILSVRCSPHRWNFECDLLGPHRTNRPRVQSMWCTPLECDLLGAHRTYRLCGLECELRGAHRATRPRALPRHAHRSLPGPLSRAPGHDRAQMIIFRNKSTTFGRGICRQPFWRFPALAPTAPSAGPGVAVPRKPTNELLEMLRCPPEGSKSGQTVRTIDATMGFANVAYRMNRT